MSEYLETKVHPATPHRRQLARESGRTAKSHDLPAAIVVLVGSLALLSYGGHLAEAVADYARSQLGGDPWLAADADSVVQGWFSAMHVAARVAGPLLGTLLLVGLLGHIGQGGLSLLPTRLAPDFSRIDPIAGWQRLFSMAHLTRLALAHVRVAAIVGVAAWCLYSERERCLALGTLPPLALAVGLLEIVVRTCLKLAATLVVLGLADYAYQRWKWERELRMTPEELREELRSQRGDPAIISRRKYLQRHLALAGVREAAARANLVIASGTALAVALRYDPQTMPAPLVVAKGSAGAAQEILHTAAQHGVEVQEHRQLARQLYRHFRVGQTIAPEHYRAVAKLWPTVSGVSRSALA
jgi:flagellar biosynthetic protein FlhB